MKALFFVICLLNILFFFWELHNGAQTFSVSQPSGLPSLILVGERDTARRGAVISAYLDRQTAEMLSRQATEIVGHLRTPRGDSFIMKGIPATNPAIAVRPQIARNKCYEAGPFIDQADARRWANGAQLTAYQAISNELATSSDFQVYYPAAKTAEQARINKMMLNAKGFTDIWVVADGENAGALSLGVFNDKQRAILFKTQLAERGVNAEIRQRTKTRPALFIRFTAPQLDSGNVSYTRLSVADCEMH